MCYDSNTEANWNKVIYVTIDLYYVAFMFYVYCLKAPSSIDIIHIL